MPCVAWNLLISYFVVWSTDPIFCKTAAIAEYLFVLVYFVVVYVKTVDVVLFLLNYVYIKDSEYFY